MAGRIRDMTTSPTDPTAAPIERIDSSFLKTLLGYNTRRATVSILTLFTQRMEQLDLKPVEFSILSLVGRNPGVMPSQLCAELNLLPPNLTKLLARLDQRQLLIRTPLANDKRAVSLSLSPKGAQLQALAETTVMKLEADAASALTAKQLETLISLLQKLY
jgi:DNA-binding MarR family transcriptional regulator